MLSDERIRQFVDDIFCSECSPPEIEYSIRAALAEIRRLRDALLDYGNHKHDFGALSEQTCTCGFSAALWG